MDQNSVERITQLLLRQLRTGLSDSEQEELNTWIAAEPERAQLFSMLNDPAHYRC